MQKSHLLVVTAILVLMAVAWFLLSDEERIPPAPPPVASPAKKLPPASPPPPPPPHAPAVVPPPPKVEGKATVAPATPPSSPPSPVATKPAAVAPPKVSLGPPSSEPLAVVSKTQVPRIDVIGPEGIQVSLEILFDNQVVCTMSGKLDAQTHRPFQGGLIAEGVCHSDKIVDKGQHEYKLLGQVRLLDGTLRDVSSTTGPKNVSGVVEPAIEINSEGEAKIKLAVG